MKIKDRLESTNKSQPETLKPTDTVQRALDLMVEKNIGSVIITDKNRIVKGIFTERDMLKRVLAEKKEMSQTKLSEVMSDKLQCANEEDNLLDWFKVMSNERFRHLPIVDEKGKLVNLLSQGDFVAHTYPDLHEKISSDLKGRMAKTLQILLIISAVATLLLIATRM